jgi:cytochrome P450
MFRRYPPGPKNYNFWCGFTWRHAWMQCADPLGFTTRLARKYGDVAFYRLFIYPTYQINHPDLVREVLVTKAASFQKVARQRELIRRIAGDGILTTDGPSWVRQRRMMLPAFQSQAGQQMGLAAVELVQQMVPQWRGQEVGIYREMTDLMVRTVSRAFFGVPTDAEAARLGTALHTLGECMLDLDHWIVRLAGVFPMLHKRRRESAQQVLDVYIKEAIRQRRDKPQSNRDLLSLLLAAVDVEGDGGRMTEKQILSEARTMFYAGHHTAAANLTWTLYLLSQHAHIYERLLQGIDSVLGGRPPQFSDLSRLPYTEQVIKESMRLYPPAWTLFAREALEPVEIGGYELPKGAWVFIYPWVLHRDERFFPDPLRFDPDRFAPERAESIRAGAYIPFGLGGHSCIGGQMAMQTLQLVLPAILQQVEPRLAPEQGPVELMTSISLRPRGDIRLRLLPRKNL